MNVIPLGNFLSIAVISTFFAVTTASAAGTNETSTASAIANASDEKVAAEADQQRMMNLLGIAALRPGRDGSHTNAPNYANYDESKANVYPNLPDPLVSNNGLKITTPELWWKLRRPEIVEDFDSQIYGRMPVSTPSVNWEVTGVDHTNEFGIQVITKHLIGHVDNSQDPQIDVNIDLTLTTPADAKASVPVIMQLAFRFPPALLARIRKMYPDLDRGPAWQKQVLAKGWGCATLIPTSIQADNGAGLTQGIIGLCNKGRPRKPDDWGALRAWAWGASRALDYFETDPNVDAKRVGIEGHSRYGKATLVAMAYDPRFAIAYVSSSGEGGAKLFRRNFGEPVENVAAASEYHWMAGNFLKYAGPLTAGDLPVDAHELIALCAPRPVFISGGATRGDGWADAKGMFMAAAAAGPVYTLLGKRDLGTTNFPPIGTLLSGDIAFRQHTSGHTDGPNWPFFLDFAEKYFATSVTN
ncbi:MAG TPA: acetylxylan esterase [Verrucomicrobiae bacterium]|nr:acetylxylan esterase [Verrucomicrobiae bacterium]